MRKLISIATAGLLETGMVVGIGGTAHADTVEDPGDVAGGDQRSQHLA